MDKKLAESTRVLIVDDQVLAQGYMKYSLQELGFKDITYAESAISALKLVSTKRFELIVCSYNLKQDHDGLFLFNEIQNKSLIPYSTAFVFISADTSTEIVHSIVDIQPDDFLAKPYTLGELDKRLGRVLKRKRALRSIYKLMDAKEYQSALNEVESLLTNPDQAEFYPLALKLKGELLLATDQATLAKDFYNAILNVQSFSWATVGLIQALIALDEDEEAEKLILRLAFKPESQLMAYDLLSALHIKQEDFDTALESVVVASEISPRNINRHQKAVELSRITHDYETQFDVAKAIVKITKDSIHEKPEHYLCAARAGIDYAMAAEEHLSRKIINQAADFVNHTTKNLPKNQLQDQMKVISARLHLLKNDKEKAKQLIDELGEHDYDTYSLEDLLDKAKAFHELGLHEHAIDLMCEIENRCQQDDSQGQLFLHYVKKEKAEKAEIKVPPRELNNLAVEQYEQGELDKALKSFQQALMVMPKSAAIALNLLQTLTYKSKSQGLPEGAQDTVFQCVKIISDSQLTPDQHERYQRVKNQLQQLS